MSCFDFNSDWSLYYHVIEFVYNSSYHVSFCMKLFEALYEWKCRPSLKWVDLGGVDITGLELVEEMVGMINNIFGAAITIWKYSDKIIVEESFV